MSLPEKLKRHWLVRRVASPIQRAVTAGGYVLPPCWQAIGWLFRSREWTNFTYDLSPKNLEYLWSLLAIVCDLNAADAERFAEELLQDEALQEHVRRVTVRSGIPAEADLPARFGKRIGWYVLARALKPTLVVETGVDKGLGAVVLCSALLRNAEQGHPGRYLGTDINPAAGYLLAGRYAAVGEIVVGDSIRSLEKITAPVDLFVNDSDHSADYEYREYRVISDKLSRRAVVVGDNAHVTDALLRFSRETSRSFMFWKEEPVRHWYPGGGIGVSWVSTGRNADNG